MFSIAKIDKKTDLVVNLEVADQEWIDSQLNNEDFYFIKYNENADIPYFPYIGYKYEKEEEYFRFPAPNEDGGYIPLVVEIFEENPELKTRYESIEKGTREFAAIIHEIEAKMVEKTLSANS